MGRRSPGVGTLASFGYVFLFCGVNWGGLFTVFPFRGETRRTVATVLWVSSQFNASDQGLRTQD